MFENMQKKLKCFQQSHVFFETEKSIENFSSYFFLLYFSVFFRKNGTIHLAMSRNQKTNQEKSQRSRNWVCLNTGSANLFQVEKRKYVKR